MIACMYDVLRVHLHPDAHRLTRDTEKQPFSADMYYALRYANTNTNKHFYLFLPAGIFPRSMFSSSFSSWFLCWDPLLKCYAEFSVVATQLQQPAI